MLEVVRVALVAWNIVVAVALVAWSMVIAVVRNIVAMSVRLARVSVVVHKVYLWLLLLFIINFLTLL